MKPTIPGDFEDTDVLEVIPAPSLKALSIQQPWAWAIFAEPPRRPAQVPAKDVENRTWRADYRGWLLIHASLKYDEDGAQWMRTQLGIHPPSEADCRRGGIIGSVKLVACVRESPSPWFCGPYGFVFAEPYPLPFHPLRGQVQFFEA